MIESEYICCGGCYEEFLVSCDLRCGRFVGGIGRLRSFREREGVPRADVVFGFTRSPEFTEKCVEARILPY